MNLQKHWEKIYQTRAADEVSWFRPHLETSLRLIECATCGDRNAAVIDVGGGASTLADDLVERGYRSVTVLDISSAALEVIRKRLGTKSGVTYITGDVTEPIFMPQSFDVWHDRAVFHFLADDAARRAYVRNVATALKPGGHAILSTFGPEGPVRCSGLDVVRYSRESLHVEFGARFQLVQSSVELHETPSGAKQQFLYCLCRVGK